MRSHALLTTIDDRDRKSEHLKSAGLQALGHRVEVIVDSYQDFGAGQFIWRLGDPAVEGYVAASDPRRDGQAVAF